MTKLPSRAMASPSPVRSPTNEFSAGFDDGFDSSAVVVPPIPPIPPIQLGASMAIPSGTSYPKMAFGTEPITGRTTNLVFPPGHVKQGTYVFFNNAVEEAAYDGLGVPASALPNVQENKHHR